MIRLILRLRVLCRPARKTTTFHLTFPILVLPILFQGLTILGVSCKSPHKQSQDSSSQSIIGGDDLKPVGFYASPNASSVGMLGVVLGGAFKTCTATHIGNGLVITAGHCLGINKVDPYKARKTCNKDSQVIIRGIRWGVSPEHPQGYLTSSCTNLEALAIQDFYDYAILKVSPAPPTLLTTNTQPVGVGTMVRVLGYPSDQVKTQSTKLWISTPCPTKTVASLPPHLVAYDCDTMSGMSGAPIINDQDEVIGIHNGSKATPTLVNFGIPLSQIPDFKAKFKPQ